MLELYFKTQEFFDEKNQKFITIDGGKLELEHSLYAISAWESKWKKVFITKEAHTSEEMLFYIRCMIASENPNYKLLRLLTQEHYDLVRQYIEDPQTATTFKETKAPPNNEVITSEVIYYMMISANIPIECEKWNINRLMALIRIHNIKSQKPKKMSSNALASRNRALNAARREQLGTKG